MTRPHKTMAAWAYATSRVAALEGPYGYCRLLRYDVCGVELAPLPKPTKTTRARARINVPMRYDGDEVRIGLEAPLPARYGSRAVLGAFRLVASSGDVRVILACDCGEVATMKLDGWRRAVQKGDKRCTKCGARARRETVGRL